MALLKDTFRSDDVEDVSFAPIPAGNYEAQIVDSDIRVTSAGTGEYIALTWEVLTEEYAGRRIFSNLNHINPNEKAVAIAKSQLKQICKAVGLQDFQDTQELHGVPVRIAVKVRPPKDGYDAQNVINKVYPLDEESGDDPWA